jgi:D-lactate dehydrogenase (cytochrome)
LIEITAIRPAEGKSDEPFRADSESLIRSRWESYLADESGYGPGKASIIFIPSSELQISQFLKEMNDSKISVTVSGGRTGIVGGAVPEGGALLSVDRMNQVVGLRLDAESGEWRITAQPGIRLRDLQQKIFTKNFGVPTDHYDWIGLPQFLKDNTSYFYPPDPTEDSASLGGTVATDASGARTYYYGRTRKHIRAVRVVLANGEVLALRRGEHFADSSNMVKLHHADGTATDIPLPSYIRPDVKCATGYYSKPGMDIIDLFIGSEGTLGVITSIEIALKTKPQTVMFLAPFPSINDAVSFVIYIRTAKDSLKSLSILSLEYLDPNSFRLLHEINEDQKLRMKIPSGSAAILSEFAYTDLEEAMQFIIEALQKFNSPMNDTISGLDERDKERLRTLRHSIPEAINSIIAKRKKNIPSLHKLGTDTAVANNRLLELMTSYKEKLDRSELEYYVIGHIAENHLHVNVIPKSLPELKTAESLVQDLAHEAVDLGGAVSAEHGIGKLKSEFMNIMYSKKEIEQMIATKRALDPNWIMSPGNMFSSSHQ